MDQAHSITTPTIRLRFQLAAFSAARMVLNTGHRMIYPFLPTFARGLGVDLETVALAVTARSALGLISPVFGSLADVRGRKTAMLVGITIFTLGMALVMLWPTYPALFIGLLSTSTAKLLFDPAMQAYLGDRVHYTRRGLAIAITEVSWSGAFLLGVPVAGWLIARTGQWNTPFAMLFVFGLLSLLALWRILPRDDTRMHQPVPFLQSMQLVLRHLPALVGLSVGLLISASNETVGIVFGAWMEEAFELKVAALGAASAVIGLAELSGEGLVGGLVDRIGKRRAVVVGVSLNVVACLLLPALNFHIESALIGLFIFFVTFEFAVVSAIPLMTELIPHARATLMAGYAAAFSAGRMIGALIGPTLFERGLLANGIAAALLDVLALILLIAFIKQD